ncbi:MAG: aminotransferase class IV [Desulfococcaceae bacterium]
MWVYLNGEVRLKDEIAISPDDRGFLFADGVYEVILSHDGRLFRAADHLERLRRSLRELKIREPDLIKIREVFGRLIQENDLTRGQATVYLQITRGVAPRKHPFPSRDTVPTVYACASAFIPLEKEWAEGIRVVRVPDIRWARCDIKSVSLLPNVLASQQAFESGAQHALFVRDGMVTEGAYTTFAAVFGGTFFTYPLSNYILPGITRQAVLELCRKMSIPVREYPIPSDDLLMAEECMLLGTTTEVMPVIQVDEQKVGNGKPGPVTRRLQAGLRELIREEGV